MTLGTTSGTDPSGRCSAARSASQELRKPALSNRKLAVGANTWMSPVQPSRSSRWGQSVGTSTKFPRIPQTTFSWNRSSCGLDELNQPVRRRSEPTTTASTSSARTSGRPLISA